MGVSPGTGLEPSLSDLKTLQDPNASHRQTHPMFQSRLAIDPPSRSDIAIHVGIQTSNLVRVRLEQSSGSHVVRHLGGNRVMRKLVIKGSWRFGSSLRMIRGLVHRARPTPEAMLPLMGSTENGPIAVADELPKVFLARAGRSGEDEELALESGLSIIGFRDIPSLASVADYDEVSKIVAQSLPGAKSRRIGNFAGQLWAFAIGMRLGDIVVLPRKQTPQIAIGRVAGPYRYQIAGGEYRHTRQVKWERLDVPRTVFDQDLLASFGAFMTVCNVSRNDAARRVVAVMAGKPDPGAPATSPLPTQDDAVPENLVPETAPDLAQIARDQIVAHIQARFTRHELAVLVDAVLQADGWVTRLSPPGADGGVDILAGQGPLGLDSPRLCVQVKSQNSPADVIVYRTLQGTMQSFKADQGLLVCWGGFNGPVIREARQGHFTVRLWDSSDLVTAIYRTYERLPEEIQAELPLKRVWMLVPGNLDE